MRRELELELELEFAVSELRSVLWSVVGRAGLHACMYAWMHGRGMGGWVDGDLDGIGRLLEGFFCRVRRLGWSWREGRALVRGLVISTCFLPKGAAPCLFAVSECLSSKCSVVCLVEGGY